MDKLKKSVILYMQMKLSFSVNLRRTTKIHQNNLTVFEVASVLKVNCGKGIWSWPTFRIGCKVENRLQFT